MRMLAWLGLALMAVGLTACQSVGDKADGLGLGSVAQITAISPDTGQVLRVGETLRLTVDISYVVAAESATIKLLVLDGGSAELGQDFVIVPKGHGSTTLQVGFTVPPTQVIRIFTPLVVSGQAQAAASSDGRAFEVLAR
jgi:hypothetical protein